MGAQAISSTSVTDASKIISLPELNLGRRIARTTWHNSDNLSVNATERNDAAQNRGVVAKPVLPQRIADDHDAIAPGHILTL